MSGFLLDTNIPSELIRARPEPRVGNWVYAKDEQSLYLSAVSIGELRRLRQQLFLPGHGRSVQQLPGALFGNLLCLLYGRPHSRPRRVVCSVSAVAD